MPGANHNDNLDDLDLGETQRAQDGTGRDAGDTLDSAPTLKGETVLAGRYRIIRELGRGAMGTVYLARDRKLDDRPVAVKMPAAVLARNPRAVRNLKQEALLAMQLSHPHIVTLRSFEETADGVFLVMDYVAGRTLEEMLSERGTLPEEEVLRLFRPVAEAIDFAHSKKVIHRDIKPSNILIAADGTPLVTDFGIAREMRDSYTRTTGKAISGTLPYMSPEQLRGDAPAPAQDVYSLAATMYECLTGNPPFYRGEIPHQIMNLAPARPERGGVIVDAVMAGLVKDPRKRPATCTALLPVPAVPLQLPGKAAVPEAAETSDARRYGAMAAGISLAAFAVIGFVLYWALSTPTSGPVTPSEKRTPDAKAPAAPAPPAPSPAPVKTLPRSQTAPVVGEPAVAPSPLAGTPSAGRPPPVPPKPPAPQPVEVKPALAAPSPKPVEAQTPAATVAPVPANQGPASVAPEASGAGGEEWTDLLRLIELPKDALRFKWYFQDGELCTSGNVRGGPTALLQVRDKVLTEYDYEAVFTLQAKDGVAFSCPFPNGKIFALTLNNYGLESGLYAGGDPRRRELPISVRVIAQPGTRHTLLIKVRLNSITAFLDGKILLEHPTDGSDIGSVPHPDWKEVRGTYGLIVYNTEVRYHSLRVKGKI